MKLDGDADFHSDDVGKLFSGWASVKRGKNEPLTGAVDASFGDAYVRDNVNPL
ncbi:MAG: hypothetical protein HY043_12785 [Verrucomicrobia bacterium]|nr:hypothetical protein [Verrucomicrobiota bacterium]